MLKRITTFVPLLLIRTYQVVTKPWMASPCIYTPSCSQYGYEAIQKYGVLKGGWLTALRIGRCHPWGPGGYDPVP